MSDLKDFPNETNISKKSIQYYRDNKKINICFKIVQLIEEQGEGYKRLSKDNMSRLGKRK